MPDVERVGLELWHFWWNFVLFLGPKALTVVIIGIQAVYILSIILIVRIIGQCALLFTKFTLEVAKDLQNAVI